MKILKNMNENDENESKNMSAGKIRTRFAPSPTGKLHIGGARTALFNYLFARGGGAAGGKFILRIDDTDAARSQSSYEAELIRDLLWLGLDWDEGPGAGGIHAPYRQSERFSLYRKYINELLERGGAYPCYCSEERLEDLRERQNAAGLPIKYDGACRNLSASARAELERKGIAPCIRIAAPDTVTIHDMLRGEYTLSGFGDFVIQRAAAAGESLYEGVPLYLFTSVVDDHIMEISHIIRGDEHLPNAARQKAIFDALGWTPPLMAHIPMILGADRHKLSKRTGSIPISDYRERGFSPRAICAYLATLSWTPPAGEFDLMALAGAFSIEKISSSSPVHDEEHLFHAQRVIMSLRDSREIWKELAGTEPRFAEINEGAMLGLLDDIKKEYATVRDMAEAVGFLINAPARGGDEEYPLWLGEFASALAELCEWDSEALNGFMQSWRKLKGIKGRDFFHPLRLILTGQDKGAALPLIMAALGKDAVGDRLIRTQVG